MGGADSTPFDSSTPETHAPCADFLSACEAINWRHPLVLDKAHALAERCTASQTSVLYRIELIRRCFHFVRDEVAHASDIEHGFATWRASDALERRVGFCFAKSHLLAALLRANHIPTALCYQRLALNDGATQFCLHGLNAVYMPDMGWTRLDARGNKPGLDAQFSPPHERLCYRADQPGEINFSRLYSTPRRDVTCALAHCQTVQEVEQHLPDSVSEEA